MLTNFFSVYTYSPYKNDQPSQQSRVTKVALISLIYENKAKPPCTAKCGEACLMWGVISDDEGFLPATYHPFDSIMDIDALCRGRFVESETFEGVPLVGDGGGLAGLYLADARRVVG